VEEREFKPYKNYQYIVADPRLLEGKLAVRGTRFSVSFILSCLAEGLGLERIEDIYGPGVRAAVPEALRAAAEAVDVPSPAALTTEQRVAELQLPGLEELIAWLGYFPSFHDAEVISISLDRTGASRIAVHTFQVTNETDEKGHSVCRKHVVVTFVLERIRDLSLEGFNSQNVLNGISLARGPDYYELVLEEIHGVAGKFQADVMRIELDPGMPSESIYGR
jgi:uncharacterized protein (DUF433 family)